MFQVLLLALSRLKVDGANIVIVSVDRTYNY